MNPRPLTLLSAEEFNESLTLNHLFYKRDVVNDKSTSPFQELHYIEHLKRYVETLLINTESF